MIEESNARVMAFKPELSVASHPSSDDVEQISREIDDVKQQICNLELDMASASMQRQKAQIQSQLISNSSEYKSCAEYNEGLRREIEATNVEKEFIDLARIEAESEYKRIKASHETDATNFIEIMEKVKFRIMRLREEIKAGEVLQKKLGITASEFNALQHEMEFTIRLMEKSTLKTRYVKDEQEVANLSALHSSRVELDAAKKLLSWLKQEGFGSMDAMDVTRKELTQIAKEKEKSRKEVKEYESRVEILEAKLHEAMSKMESASAAETRADAIVASLSVALRQLHSDIGAAKREAELAREETKAVGSQIEKTKSRTESVEERLGAAMEALKNAKASESMALEELQQVTESTMTERAISALWSDTITISKFEYYYLIKQGKEAKEVAEKKVTAALAWKEVFEAKEKEKRSAKPESESVERWAIVAVDQEIRGNDLVIPWSSHNMKLAIAMPRRSLHVSGHSSTSRLLRKQPSFTSIAPRTLEYSKKKGKLMEKVVRFLNGHRNCHESIKISACVI